ncbi:hypothetical protein H9Q74_000030 [Fusarium xylarioides]|nr:hypothetical protein H9Q71_000132 [Fusarium xylarioides]KAG5829877.1 hypothetical protein H9Q74_000030 [Fusarium xylarioides]
MSSELSLYSQAFGFGNSVHHSVDPRTGQYSCSISLYRAPSKARNCPTFELSLYHDALSSRDSGLGEGWLFNTSTYRHRYSKTLSLFTGEHYQVTETETTFDVKDQKLKSFLFERRDNGYRIVHKSGDIEIMSNENNMWDVTVPVEIYAANGRSLKLEWTSFGETPRLSKIKDGSETLLEIQYLVFQVDVIRSPNTPEESVISLIQHGDMLTELKLPQEGSWQFDYEPGGPYTLIQRVTSPAGLVEELSYDREGHRLPIGAPVSTIPYVISHTMVPGSNQPDITTLYTYSDFNFLGHGGVNNWDPDEDNLYRAGSEYEYSSTSTVEDGATLTCTYNKYHLMTSSRREQGTKAVTQTTTYHAIEDEPFDCQPAHYQLPKVIEATYEDLAKDGAKRTEKTRYHFDSWGNPTETTNPDGTRITREYYAEQGENGLCPADPNGFRRHVKKETITPPASAIIAKPTSQEFQYLRLPTATGADNNDLVAVSQTTSLEDDQILSCTNFTYTNEPESRDHGRIKKHVFRLHGEYPTTRDSSYDYPGGNYWRKRVTATSFDGLTVLQEATVSLATDMTLGHKDEHGVETRYQYDSLDRVIEEKTAPATDYEATRKTEYAVVEDGVGYQITQTEANGVQTRYTTDGMERVILVERQEPNDRFRPVESCLYNKVGQCFQVEKIDWLKIREGEATEIRTKQQNQYDDWGEACQSMDTTGMVTINAYDPISLTRTTGIFGGGTVKTKVNLVGKPTEVVTIKSDGTIYSKTSCEYDGRGRLVKERDALGRITDYQFDSFDRIIQKTGPDGHVVQTSYAPQSPDDHPASIKIGPYTIAEQQFDGLGRPTIVNQGQRTTSGIYQGSAPNPSRVVLADGAIHDISYEPSIGYKVKSITAPEGEESYVRDKKTAAILNLQNKEMTVNRAYSPSGLLAAETFKMQDGNKLSASATHSLAGELCSYTDVHEQTREIEYDAFGRASKLIQGATTVDFEYNKANLVSKTTVTGEEKEKCMGLEQVYDDFGNEVERIVRRGSGGVVLYKIQQKFGQTGLINERRVENGPGDLLREEYFTYDVRDRLVDYRCNGPECPEDQNGWKLLRQSFAFDALDNVVEISTDSQDGKSNTRCHEYSPHDPTKVLRVTNTHKDLPSAITLQYNDSGCLTRDEEGRSLEYDTRNRLVTVRSSSNNVMCKYHYDALGKLVRQEVEGQPDNQLHYHDGALVAITKGESKTSYLTDGHTYWGESTQHGEQDAITELWASDSHKSILASIGAGNHSHLSYTPYGFSKESPAIGFNGQWRDPVTGWYHLGNGYRVYNPSLMRFHAPDSWSPFVSNEINPYAYCLGDPVNNTDPSGHMTGRDWTVLGVGLATGILVVSLTAGAGLAVAVGASIAVGAVTDAATGAIYDAATGTAPTLESVGTDMLFGAIGGAAGELVGRGLAAGARAVSRFTRGILEAGAKLRVAGGLPGDIRLNPRYIRFSQDTIGNTLSGPPGRRAERVLVRDAIRNLQGIANIPRRLAAIAEYPVIKVVKLLIHENGKWVRKFFSIDNRRLAVFKEALTGVKGGRIKVKQVSFDEALEKWTHFTTNNHGTTVAERGSGVIYPSIE